MLNRALTYGLLAAAGGAAWTLIEYALGFHTTRLETGRYTGFAAIVFPILAIWLALKAARAEHGGRLSFGQGLKQGAAVSAVQAVAGALFFLVYFTIVNPRFFDALAASGQTSTAGEQVTILLVSSFVAGLVISLIAALLMRRSHARDAR